MSSRKLPRLEILGSPLNNPFMWWMLRLRPSRTVDILRWHLGLKRVPSDDMERISWKVLVENCPPGEVAEVLLQRLDPSSRGRLLDLTEREMQMLLGHLERHARTRLEALDLPLEEREMTARQPLRLAEAALEKSGDLAAAAALYSLAHDHRASRQDAETRVERLILRVKLGNTLLRRAEGETESLACCIALGKGTLAQLESLRRAGSVPAEAVRPIELELLGWLGHRCQEERMAVLPGSDFDPGEVLR